MDYSWCFSGGRGCGILWKSPALRLHLEIFPWSCAVSGHILPHDPVPCIASTPHDSFLTACTPHDHIPKFIVIVIEPMARHVLTAAEKEETKIGLCMFGENYYEFGEMIGHCFSTREGTRRAHSLFGLSPWPSLLNYIQGSCIVHFSSI